MKLIHTCLLAGWMVCLFSVVKSQENFSCGTDQKLQQIYMQHPELKQEHQQLLLNSRQYKQQRDGSIRMVYTIPVVFHIIHEYGNENISDSQVYDQMAILNRDYRKLNADTSQVVTEFDTLIADCNIEFRLATIDFQGNCTNGIEHIYSHETNIGDDYSKLNQWPRNKYLNVWIVKSMRDGVAGYAYYPTAVEGFLIFADGVIILQDYIGSIGTSSIGRSRALTHEIGHYLGLSHPWGDTNDPMQSCGDDGMDDTPETKGFNYCPGSNYQTTAAICNPPIVENFQNYMDYSYCSKMFTPDQSFYMNFTLQNPTANRDNLVTAENLTETGADISVAPVCTPVADFHTDYYMVCEGESVDFFDDSWRAVVDTYEWTFPTGTPSTSNLANPSVTFNGPGYHSATLKVSNAAGTTIKTIPQAVWVSYGWVDNVGPHSEDFEGATADDWYIMNPEDNMEKFTLINNVGLSGNHCYQLKNHFDGGSFDPFYQQRMGGRKDALISPAFDLSNTTSATLTFNYSSATMGATPDQFTEELKIYSSIDCGKNWILRKTISGVTLHSAGSTSSNFIPTHTNQWASGTYTIPASILQDNVRFKFEYTSSDFSNNLYLDDININGILGTNEIENEEISFRLFPNPNTQAHDIYILTNENSNYAVTIADINGKIIYSEKRISDTNGSIKISSENVKLSSGVYLINISDDIYNLTKKLVVL